MSAITNVLINARAVGAVPVLSNLPPYDSLGSAPPALLCENDPAAWYDALARLMRDPACAIKYLSGRRGSARSNSQVSRMRRRSDTSSRPILHPGTGRTSLAALWPARRWVSTV